MASYTLRWLPLKYNNMIYYRTAYVLSLLQVKVVRNLVMLFGLLWLEVAQVAQAS
jgi:hypothetical protein